LLLEELLKSVAEDERADSSSGNKALNHETGA
jgi:hypothetical protein